GAGAERQRKGAVAEDRPRIDQSETGSNIPGALDGIVCIGKRKGGRKIETGKRKRKRKRNRYLAADDRAMTIQADLATPGEVHIRHDDEIRGTDTGMELDPAAVVQCAPDPNRSALAHSDAS